MVISTLLHPVWILIDDLLANHCCISQFVFMWVNNNQLCSWQYEAGAAAALTPHHATTNIYWPVNCVWGWVDSLVVSLWCFFKRKKKMQCDIQLLRPYSSDTSEKLPGYEGLWNWTVGMLYSLTRPDWFNIREFFRVDKVSWWAYIYWRAVWLYKTPMTFSKVTCLRKANQWPGIKKIDWRI